MIRASLVLLFLTGCASPKATFQVAVKNETRQPLSVGLVKAGGKMERGWDGPEHIAIYAPMYTDRKWGRLVEPGGSVTLGPQTGTFYQGSLAVLRIYAADTTVDELLGYSRTDSGRLDITLLPGTSAYVIEQRGDGLHYRPVARPAGAAKD